jgi:hypothetical protein
MDRAAIGVRMHSGWGAMVAVSISAGHVEILDRRRLTVIPPETRGAKQPYHFAEGLEFSRAEKFINRCFAASLKLASAALHQAADELRKRQYRVTGTAVLRASGRPLPPLANILSSHALIHAAEGEFFRDIIFKACEGLDLAVTGIRERDLEDHLQKEFGRATPRMHQQVSEAGRSLGPPWTQDQKTAALAALAVLGNRS